MKSNEALYPIREVSNLTGVNSITLRAWERRYGLIEPVRTEGGHRLYTLAHIERIKAAVKLTEAGIPIGQVKARLAQTAPQLKQEIQQGDYDYQSKIIEAALAFDLDSLNSELDQAFIDVSEGLLFSLLTTITQRLSADSTATAFIFWESQLLPRLYTRLRFANRYLTLHACKSLWLQSAGAKDSKVALLLAAIRLAEKGIYSVISPTSEKDDQVLLKHIKATHCQGLGVVDENKQFDEKRWKAWVKAHPGLEFHYFVEDADNLDMGSDLQCHAYHLNHAF